MTYSHEFTRFTTPRTPWPVETLPYGRGAERVGDLRLPDRAGPHPVMVLVHGGFWRLPWDRNLNNALAVDLAQSGIATWSIEYHRVGSSEGGWPGTLNDVSAAVSSLKRVADEHELDLSRAGIWGHSAGGQLAMYAAAVRPVEAQDLLPTTGMLFRVAISAAGVLDLRAGAEAGLGDGGDAVTRFLGGSPPGVPDRYAAASPIERLPLGIRQFCVHGDKDNVVPIEQSRNYVERAVQAGDQAEFLPIAGANHFDVIDPEHPAWRLVKAWLAEQLLA